MKFYVGSQLLSEGGGEGGEGQTVLSAATGTQNWRCVEEFRLLIRIRLHGFSHPAESDVDKMFRSNL